MPKYKPELRFDVATFSETDARYFSTSTYLPHSGGAPVVPNEVPRVRVPKPDRRPEVGAVGIFAPPIGSTSCPLQVASPTELLVSTYAPRRAADGEARIGRVPATPHLRLRLWCMPLDRRRVSLTFGAKARTIRI